MARGGTPDELARKPVHLQLVLLGLERAGRVDQQAADAAPHGATPSSSVRCRAASSRKASRLHPVTGVGMPSEGAGAEAGRIEQDGVDAADRGLFREGNDGPGVAGSGPGQVGGQPGDPLAAPVAGQDPSARSAPARPPCRPARHRHRAPCSRPAGRRIESPAPAPRPGPRSLRGRSPADPWAGWRRRPAPRRRVPPWREFPPPRTARPARAARPGPAGRSAVASGCSTGGAPRFPRRRIAAASARQATRDGSTGGRVPVPPAAPPSRLRSSRDHPDPRPSRPPATVRESFRALSSPTFLSTALTNPAAFSPPTSRARSTQTLTAAWAGTRSSEVSW